MANCVVCGVPREKHGTYPTCATHEFRDCCSATPSEPYRKDCWDAGQCLSVQWILVHQIEWDNAPPTYEVRRVGRCTSCDYEPGECLGVFQTRAEAEEFARGVETDRGGER